MVRSRITGREAESLGKAWCGSATVNLLLTRSHERTPRRQSGAMRSGPVSTTEPLPYDHITERVPRLTQRKCVPDMALAEVTPNAAEEAVSIATGRRRGP
jgi:hypothetical protein